MMMENFSESVQFISMSYHLVVFHFLYSYLHKTYVITNKNTQLEVTPSKSPLTRGNFTENQAKKEYTSLLRKK